MIRLWNFCFAAAAIGVAVIGCLTTAQAERLDVDWNDEPIVQASSSGHYNELLEHNPEVLRKLSALVESNPQLKAELNKFSSQATLPPATYAQADAQANAQANAVTPANNALAAALPSTDASGQATAPAPAPTALPSSAPTTTTGPEAPFISPEIKSQIKQNAFEAVKDDAFPLTPHQIKELHNMLDDTQRATAADPHDYAPEPTSSSTIVNLSPGSVPPVIRLARGFVTSLVFIDSTGAAWPIHAYDLGNPQAFDIQWNKKDNTLMVQARTGYTYGNLAVKLQQLDTPVMITLVPGQRMVDYRVDLRIQGMGPQAKPILQGSGLPGQADARLLSILDGIPPKGAKALLVEGSDAQAWLLNNTVYFRSRFMVISPAWISEMSSADGMHAYEMPKTPLILVSRHGKTTHVRLEGF